MRLLKSALAVAALIVPMLLVEAPAQAYTAKQYRAQGHGHYLTSKGRYRGYGHGWRHRGWHHQGRPYHRHHRWRYY